jgi:hypothetical protein
MLMRALKKKREIFVCRCVADEMNRTQGTDYKAICSGADFPDALLVSQSETLPQREVEVVSTPQDFAIRDDNENIRILEDSLSQALADLGVSGFNVLLYPTKLAAERRTQASLIGKLAELIASNTLKSHYRYITDVEIYKALHEASRIITGIRVYRLPTSALQVGSVRSWYAPRDGRWIAEIARKKLNRYESKVVSNLVLVIDGQVHLDSEQINAFCATLTQRDIPFLEIWTVTMGKAYRLRPLPL